jgi:hypothetical protein
VGPRREKWARSASLIWSGVVAPGREGKRGGAAHCKLAVVHRVEGVVFLRVSDQKASLAFLMALKYPFLAREAALAVSECGASDDLWPPCGRPNEGSKGVWTTRAWIWRRGGLWGCEGVGRR